MSASRPSVAHIMSVYRRATAEQRQAGRAWYRLARATAELLDPQDPVRAAAVIAVLSPRVSWDRNITLAADAYAGRGMACLRANAIKADRLIAGEDPDDVVSGPKVRAFWHAIVNPDDAAAIVVDRHALDIAVGVVLDDAQRGSLLGRKGAYDSVARLYRLAARRLSREYGEDLTAVDVQATTWVVWRAEKRSKRS